MSTAELLKSWNLPHLIDVFEETHSAPVPSTSSSTSQATFQVLSELSALNNFTNNANNRNKKQLPIINIPIRNTESTDNNNNDEVEDAGEIIAEQDILNLKFEEHLRSTTEGSAFLVAKDNPFNNSMKNRLTRFIVAYELDKAKKKHGADLTMSQFVIDAKKFLTYTKAIVKFFPKEERSPYYISYQADANENKCGPKGKLYSHYNFIKGKLRKDHVLTDTGNPSNANKFDEPTLNNTSDSTEKLDWLQNNAHPFDKVKSYWSASFHERRKLLMHHHLSVQEYLAKFLCLKSNSGHLLIAQDFQKLFPGKSNNLFKNWPLVKPKLLENFRRNKKPRHSSDQVLLDSLATLDPAKQDAVFLHLLPLLMNTAYVKIPQTAKTNDISEPQAKKKRNLTKRRASLQESRDGLFIIVPTVANLDRIIEEKRAELQTLNLSLQPIPVIIGTLREVEDIYVIIDDNKYRVCNTLTAIDFTFKLTQALDCKYPEAALNSWLFIQASCYDIPIKTKNFSQSVQCLVSSVKN